MTRCDWKKRSEVRTVYEQEKGQYGGGNSKEKKNTDELEREIAFELKEGKEKGRIQFDLEKRKKRNH